MTAQVQLIGIILQVRIPALSPDLQDEKRLRHRRNSSPCFSLPGSWYRLRPTWHRAEHPTTCSDTLSVPCCYVLSCDGLEQNFRLWTNRMLRFRVPATLVEACRCRTCPTTRRVVGDHRGRGQGCCREKISLDQSYPCPFLVNLPH